MSAPKKTFNFTEKKKKCLRTPCNSMQQTKDQLTTEEIETKLAQMNISVERPKGFGKTPKSSMALKQDIPLDDDIRLEDDDGIRFDCEF